MEKHLTIDLRWSSQLKSITEPEGFISNAVQNAKVTFPKEGTTHTV